MKPLIKRNDNPAFRIVPKPVVVPKTPLAVCATEAAELLNISVPTLRKLTKEGKLPAKNIGRKILYSVDKLREFINS
jgi:excisionase family DNA binding protein